MISPFLTVVPISKMNARLKMTKRRLFHCLTANLIGPLAFVYSLIEQNRTRAVLDKGKVVVLFAAKFQSVY